MTPTEAVIILVATYLSLLGITAIGILIYSQCSQLTKLRKQVASISKNGTGPPDHNASNGLDGSTEAAASQLQQLALQVLRYLSQCRDRNLAPRRSTVITLLARDDTTNAAFVADTLDAWRMFVAEVRRQLPGHNPSEELYRLSIPWIDDTEPPWEKSIHDEGDGY